MGWLNGPFLSAAAPTLSLFHYCSFPEGDPLALIPSSSSWFLCNLQRVDKKAVTQQRDAAFLAMSNSEVIANSGDARLR